MALERGGKKKRRQEEVVLEGTTTLCWVVNPPILSSHQHNYQSATALGNVYAGFSSKFITIIYEKEELCLSNGIALSFSSVDFNEF